MENKQLYIKYLKHQPIKIETAYTWDGKFRDRPLTTVAHLVAAFQARPGSALANTDSGRITIHFISDGVETSYNSWDSLTILGDNGRLVTSPLIIRSLNDMDEYMVWPLLQPEYENPMSRFNTSGETWKRPAHVFLWPDFKLNVLDWIEANHHQHSQRVNRPVFVPRVITEEVQTLQPFILDNLLSVSAKCFIPPSEFKTRRQITSCIGEPDRLMTRNGEIVAIVEVEEKWTLPTDDVVNSYNTTGACESAVNQLYHYMRLNHRKYGILTSYENTWLVYRSQECVVCKDSQVHETLYVSEGISFTARTPTVQQCLAYFNSIVDYVHMDSPPILKRPSMANSATQIIEEKGPRVSPHSSICIESSSLSSPIQINEQPQDFNVEDFKFDTVLGEGRSKVYLEYYESNQIALKVADIAKHREMLAELLNEVSVYEQLSELQGNGIPRFVCHGFMEDILYCVGVAVCGSVANGFTEQQKQKLLETLKIIHEAGILHNDIKKENILIDISGNPYIIDFGFASRDCSPVAQMKEMNILLNLFENI